MTVPKHIESQCKAMALSQWVSSLDSDVPMEQVFDELMVDPAGTWAKHGICHWQIVEDKSPKDIVVMIDLTYQDLIHLVKYVLTVKETT